MAKRILITEDIEDSRFLIVCMIHKFGYETIEAATGAEAIQKAISKQPDLILMDLGLPDIPGIDAAKTIRENPSTAHIPIIAHTAWDLPDRKEAARGVGMVDYLVKPVPMKLLRESIEQFTNSGNSCYEKNPKERGSAHHRVI
jgi:two-component system, cell cycle response regulator DivK